MIKIVGTEKETKIEAIDDDKTVVVYGSLYQPITELNTTVGLSRLAVLKGYLDYPLFDSDNSSISIDTQLRNEVEVPSEIKFDSGSNHVASYRLMNEEMINEQIKVPPFKGATWNVTVSPTKTNIRDLSYFNGILGNFETTFTVSTKDKKLYFAIGSGPTDRTMFAFAEGLTGELKHQWSWPLNQVISILKMSDSADCKMSFSDQGALKIELDSGVGKYEYILPARQK
jgi:hypothetical protein